LVSALDAAVILLNPIIEIAIGPMPHSFAEFGADRSWVTVVPVRCNPGRRDAGDLLAPTRVGSKRGPRTHDGTIIPETVDTMWGTVLTATFTSEGQAAVFIAVDHCSAECIGIHAHARATRFETLEPIRQGVRQYFGGFDKAVARGLKVRHDHGSQYMSDHFQKEIAFLGIESSPAFVCAPEGNGCAERFIRTLKENLLWLRTFETIEELRQALLAFRDTNNTNWLIERHGFITPTAFRQRQLQPVAQAA
jgi:putative transposase